MHKNFKSETEISNLFQKAFAVLYAQGYQRASPYFKRAFIYNPYPIDVHYRLALHFIEYEEEELFLHYLTICYDIDHTYYEKALNENVVKANFNTKALSVIKEDATMRAKQIMSFGEISPIHQEFQVMLKIKPKAKKSIEDIYYSLSDKGQSYFNIYENVFYDKSRVANEIILRGNGDYSYYGYEKIYLAIKAFSPYVENVRFFMSAEDVAWVDEIKIQDGIFYSHRHRTATIYHSDKIALYEKLVKADATDKALRIFLSFEYLRLAESALEYVNDDGFSSAKKYLQKAAVFLPQNPHIDYIWAKYHLQRGEITTAKKHLIKASKKTTNFEVFSTLGELALQEADYPAVINYFTKAIHLHPTYTKLHLLRGIGQEHLGKIQKAYTDYIKEIKNTTGNYNASLLIGYGNQLLHYRFYKSASLFYHAAIKKAKRYKQELQKRELQSPGGDDTGFYTNQQITTDKTIANGFMNLSLTVENLQQQLSFCDKALHMNPAMIDVWYNKGLILQKMGKLEDAHKHYDMALTLDNNYIKAINNKFILYYTKKNYWAALDVAKKLIEIDPSYSNGWLNLGNAYIYLKKYEDAIPAYSKLVELAPAYEKGYHGLAGAYAWLKKHKESIGFCKKALRINPNLPEVISTMASGYNNLNKYSQALKYAEAAIQLKPDYYHPYYIKACVYAKRKEVAKALPMIKKTLKLDPSQLETLRNESDFKPIREHEAFKKLIQII